MVFNISTKANQPPCHIHSAKPTLKHHQYKHHQRHESINVNPILTGCSDDHPVVRRASTCESHIHKSYTTRPKRVNHHGTYTLCKPTLKHHQYKHHQRHKSININSILTGCSDDHPAVRHASTCESHIHKSNTTRPKRANHHDTHIPSANQHSNTININTINNTNQ